MRKLLFILISLTSIALTAQDIQVISEEKLPVSDVLVYSKKGEITFYTNQSGLFNISLFSKYDTIYFQHPGYNNKSLAISDILKSRIVTLQSKVFPVISFVIEKKAYSDEIIGIPNQTDLIHQKQISQSNAQSSGDLLQESGVFVQKSQMGGGSPVLRGFEANKVLLIVDNIRMNNAIFRGGHLQNSLLIDPFNLRKAEIIYGPGASKYGSDALGGVIHFKTKHAQLAIDDSINFKSNIVTRFSTANKEKSLHYDVNIGHKKWASFTSYSRLEFQDLMAGKNIHPNYPDYGTLPFYFTRINDQDYTVENDQPFLQIGTGFNIHHLGQKFLLKLRTYSQLELNLQYSFTDHIPRFDRLNDIEGNEMKYAQWHYFPQSRKLFATKYNNIKKQKLYDSYSLQVALQNLEEGRLTRKFNSEWSNQRIENINVWSVNLDFKKRTPSKKDYIFYGIEYLFNDLTSTALSYHINNDSTANISTRYPNGGSNMQTRSAYFVWRHQINKVWDFQSSIRENYTKTNAFFSDQTFYPFPYSNISLDNNAVTGGFAFLYDQKQWKAKINISNAFRTPNIDDLAKVFDSEPGEIIVPNPELKPEIAYNAELNINYIENDKFLISANGFVTYVDQLIERASFQFNGQDSILYDGTLSQVLAQQNTGQAILYGTSIKTRIFLSKDFVFDASWNYTKGTNIIDNSPMAHIPPIYGRIGTSYKLKKHTIHVWSIYNGTKTLEQYSDDSVDRLNEATVDGTPAWYTINSKWIYQVNKNLYFNFSVENILDRNYKPFSSGPFAPGRNFIVSMNLKF